VSGLNGTAGGGSHQNCCLSVFVVLSCRSSLGHRRHRRQRSVITGVHEGVGRRLLKFFAEILPVLEKGGEVLTRILVGVEVVIAIKGFGSGVGCCFGNVTSRNCM